MQLYLCHTITVTKIAEKGGSESVVEDLILIAGDK